MKGVFYIISSFLGKQGFLNDDQVKQMAQALQASGSRRVEIVQIAGRTHMSILRKLPEDGDPAAARVVDFVRAVSGVP